MISDCTGLDSHKEILAVMALRGRQDPCLTEIRFNSERRKWLVTRQQRNTLRIPKRSSLELRGTQAASRQTFWNRAHMTQPEECSRDTSLLYFWGLQLQWNRSFFFFFKTKTKQNSRVLNNIFPFLLSAFWEHRPNLKKNHILHKLPFPCQQNVEHNKRNSVFCFWEYPTKESKYGCGQK